MAGKGIYGGDTNLEARVDSLESGDAWSNKTTGYVPVVQADESIAWEAASDGGGGADLSGVDQDITLLNGHRVEMHGDPEDEWAQGTLRFSDDYFGVVVSAVAPNNVGEFYVAEPDVASATASYVRINSGKAGGQKPKIQMQGSDGIGGQIGGAMQLIGQDTWLISGDIVHDFFRGPVLLDEEGGYHRLKVAPDGSLSTEPVTP